MEAEETEMPSADVPTNLVPCSVCGRTFRPEALERHEKICQKNLTKKRKVYDSSKKRAEGTELESLPKSRIPDHKKEKPKPKSNWREKHQEFIQAIRAAKGVPGDEDDVEIKGTSKQITVPVGYVQCPSCGRNFNERAADRHISWCKEQKTRIAKSPSSNDASERLKARTKYRAPLPSKSSAKSEKKVPESRQIPKTPAEIEVKSDLPPKKAIAVPSDKNNNVKRNGNITQPLKTNRKVIAKPLTKAQQKDRTSPDKNHVVKKYPQQKYDNSTSAYKQSLMLKPAAEKASLTSRNIMKFKEKFPNHIHRNFMVDQPDDEFQQDLRDLLRNNTVFSKAPRTVPGVRTGGNNQTNEVSNRNVYKNNNEMTDMQLLQDRMKELGTSFRNGNVDFDMSWAKKLSHWDTRGATDNMPQIGSSDNTSYGNQNTDPWAPVSADETRVSTGNSSSGSDSTLPPISRGSSGSDVGNRLPRFCHQCGTKYPLTVAKYCCECGARRVANAAAAIT